MLSCCFLGVGCDLLRELCLKSSVVRTPDVSWILVKYDDKVMVMASCCMPGVHMVFFLELCLRIERMGLFDHGFGLRLVELGCCYCQSWSKFTYDVCFR